MDEKSGGQQSREGLIHRSARHYVSKLSDTNEKRTKSPKSFFVKCLKADNAKTIKLGPMT